jgi:DNA-binding Lrp family transcriptional regulator
MDWPLNASRTERLLNEWQRGFPLSNRPFAQVGQALAATETEAIELCGQLLARGAISRVGGVWAPGAGGAALLCAMAVPPDRLQAVASAVNALPGVNHNYEREHTLNLWFVLTGVDAAQLDQALAGIERATALPVLRMKMVRPYRIDLGFDLHRPARAHTAPHQPAPRVAPEHRALAALVEAGLPLVPEPYAHWAARLGCTPAEVQRQLQAWLDAGTLRRLGLVVRHHEAGFAANAMTVFDAPDDAVDALGRRLAAQPGVTLCYRRERAAGWRYNLYCMVHGRSREATLALLHGAIAGAGLGALPREVLFSRRRFKQTGSRYFRGG